MKQYEIIKAYKAIENIQHKKASLKVSYAFFKIKKLLQPQYDFQLEQEKAVYSQFEYTVGEDGRLNFGSQEKAAEFSNTLSQRLAELEDLDIDLEFTKPVINTNESIEMSVDDIVALEPFIEFTE